MTDTADDVVLHDLVPTAEPSRTGPAARWTVGIAIAALLAAGGFALAYLQPQANTPEEAVRSLVTAITDEDVLGALDALAPSERDLLRDTLVDVTGELRRLDVLDDDADLSGVRGVDAVAVDCGHVAASVGRDRAGAASRE